MRRYPRSVGSEPARIRAGDDPAASPTPRCGSRSSWPTLCTENPDHHIWCNNGTWFLHLTVEWRGQRRRLRTSLKTRDVGEARARRDRFLACIAEDSELRLARRRRGVSRSAGP
jgi:hypothetical protein